MKVGAKLNEHLMDAFYEDVEFPRSDGLIDEHIAWRLGVSLDTFDKRMERKK